MNSPDFDSQTLAVLRGRMVRYLMRSREVRLRPPSRALLIPLSSPSLLMLPFLQITLGRATKDNQIDVDLALEGPAWKISRKQGREQGWAVLGDSGAQQQLCSPPSCTAPLRCHQAEEQWGLLHR